MSKTAHAITPRQDAILQAAIGVFGRYGFKKASVDDLAEAAGLSKQGLYLHFAGKEAIFLAAMRKYLDDGLLLVDAALNAPGQSLHLRLMGAMEGWFGRHLSTFSPASLDLIEAGAHLSMNDVDQYKLAFQSKVSSALAESSEFQDSGNRCTPSEVAAVLFHCGLTWKEGGWSKAEFMNQVRLCIRVCCQTKT